MMKEVLKKPENLRIEFSLPLKKLETTYEWRTYLSKPLEETSVSCVIIFVSEKHKEIPLDINLLKVIYENEKILGVVHVIVYLKDSAIVGADLLISGGEEYISDEIMR